MTIASELADLIAEVARGAGVTGRVGPEGTTWTAGGQAIATLNGDVLELRLDPVIAAAARRTPDTGRSPRGPEWVTFHPRTLDQFASDRVRAWFGASLRRAEGARQRAEDARRRT